MKLCNDRTVVAERRWKNVECSTGEASVTQEDLVEAEDSTVYISSTL